MIVKYNVNFQMSSTQGGGVGGASQDKANNDNKSAQCNPTSQEYKGHTPGYSGTGTKADLDNHGNQLNPNNPNFQPKK